MMVVRRLLGGVLRRQRQRQGRTLREVSAEAQVSLGYLSEVERGEKEASSELIAAICAALDIPLSAIFREVSDELAEAETALGVLTPVGADSSPVPDTVPDSLTAVGPQRLDSVQIAEVVVAA